MRDLNINRKLDIYIYVCNPGTLARSAHYGNTVVDQTHKLVSFAHKENTA